MWLHDAGSREEGPLSAGECGDVEGLQVQPLYAPPAPKLERAHDRDLIFCKRVWIHTRTKTCCSEHLINLERYREDQHGPVHG